MRKGNKGDMFRLGWAMLTFVGILSLDSNSAPSEPERPWIAAGGSVRRRSSRGSRHRDVPGATCADEQEG